MKGRSGLGRGLEALIPQISEDHVEEIFNLRLDEIHPNPYQPRRTFDDDKIQDLMNSIKEHGVLQPIVVRNRVPSGYEIIAGERRFRAVQSLNEGTIPAIIRKISDKEAMELALIENIQREDLNPIEVADAYSKLMELFSLTQEELSIRVGQSRSHVANLLRLLTLPADIRDYVSRGTISMGHARALLGIKDRGTQIQVVKKIIDEGINVRSVEQFVQHIQDVSRGTKEKNTSKNKSKSEMKDPTLINYEEIMREYFGTSVKIDYKSGKGKIEIEYYTDDDLERILELLRIHNNHKGIREDYE